MSSSPQPDRLAIIFGSCEAVGREMLARHLVAQTTMTPEQAIETLAAAPRGGEAGIAAASATASAAVARALLGLPSDPQADLRLGQSIGEAHAKEAAERRRVAAEREQAEKDFASGREAALRLLGRAN